MRKRTIRNGMRLVLAALVLIIVASFYHADVSDFLTFSAGAERRFYSLGIFWAAAMGGYGVVLAAFGLVLPATPRDAGIRLLPVMLIMTIMVMIFFYLFAASLNAPVEERRLRPGDTITI